MGRVNPNTFPFQSIYTLAKIIKHSPVFGVLGHKNISIHLKKSNFKKSMFKEIHIKCYFSLIYYYLHCMTVTN